jgi:hypothetical protein
MDNVNMECLYVPRQSLLQEVLLHKNARRSKYEGLGSKTSLVIEE